MPVPLRVRELVEEVVLTSAYDLVHIEYRREQGGWVLRLFIDKKEEGITHQDCITVSREVGTRLDAEDVIPHRYRLEVSSPGLDRPLSRPEDFRRFAGQKVKIRTTEAIGGTRTFRGVLRGVVDGEEGLCVSVEGEGGEEYRLPLEQIGSARLTPDLVS